MPASCPTAEEQAYFDGVYRLTGDIALTSLSLVELLEAVTLNVSLAYDDEWNTKALSEARALGTQAESLRQIPYPESVSDIQRDVVVFAIQVDTAPVYLASGIADYVDVEAITTGFESYEYGVSFMERAVNKAEALCP